MWFCWQVALNGLENILRLGEQESKETGGANPYAVIIEEVFGLDKIEFLQSHENMEIYQKAFDIIERYFGTEEEDKEVGEGFVFVNYKAVLWHRIRICFGRLDPDPGGQKWSRKNEKVKKFHVLKFWMFTLNG